MTARVAALSADKAFFHVVYEYRYFGLACAGWRQFGPNGTSSAQDQANALLPGIGVLFQDSLLAHARGLIDFYVHQEPRNEDVVVGDFPLAPLSPQVVSHLRYYKEPIEVHLLHITAWRDVAFRKAAAQTPKGLPRQRMDWNVENDRVCDVLFTALNEVSSGGGSPWRNAFLLLEQSARALLTDPGTDWPAELGKATDVAAYLKGLGV